MKPSDKIWLKPECDKCDERCWSCAPFDDCEECGKETIGYVRDDIVLASTAEASRMFDRIEKLEAALRVYADEDHWFGDKFEPIMFPEGECKCCYEHFSDQGEIARKALEGKDG